jgi:hypothetical protein
VLPIYPDVLEGYAAKCCDESAALTWQTRSRVVGARLATGGNDSNLLMVERGSGDTRPSAEDRRVEVEASVVVDTSGDGAVAALAGADCEMAPPDELQAPSFIFRLSDVDPGELEGFARLKLSVAAAGAARSGALPEDCGSILVRPGGAPGEALVTLTLPPLPGRQPALLDPVYLREMRERGRERAERIADFLRATRPGFARSRLLGCARSLGVRETRRVMGQVVMGRKQILGGVRRDDEVAVSTWPIELWSDHRRARFSYPVGPSSVPLGALVSRSHPRLGAAGRCLSASHEALGALRVIGCALATGEAVGVAAALAADQGVALTDIAPAAVRDAIVSLSGG